MTHGPKWPVILMIPAPKADLGLWVTPLLAISVFSMIRFTKTSKRLFELVIEWIYDHSAPEL